MATLPRETALRQDDTHRMIPSRWVDRGKSVLARVTESEPELAEAFALDGATNERLAAEAGGIPGITVRELVFGVAYAHIVNAAFAHPNPEGTRFAGRERGVWYAAFERDTAVREVAHHRQKMLNELPTWNEPDTVEYVDFLADFHASLHDIRKDQRFADCLDPDDYGRSQALGARLLEAGSGGLVYPSVRAKSGTCVACFRPTLVGNVRKGETTRLKFRRGSGGKYRLG